ncbi:hypothetical protein [Deinococcus arenicola]|uniref:Uncharacterized protein n=1 Tax=Deinococcus arenicola TaxID=2994950 RepID=A0ABU4DVS7_9DEIO|nr:hypothetical protein [Deinococcus sp. ZS9-10]MDV6376498.1 hypothetical protein [Deinococcus sp. ZS9-10]
MSVILFNPNEIKSLENAAVELCGPHVGGMIWPALYVSNRRAYMLRYADCDLTEGEEQGHRREYGQAQAQGDHTADELMDRLQQLFYNCEDLENAAEEQARRVLVDSVAFELLPTGGGERTVNVDRFANIQRPDFDHYRITTRNPADGQYARVYLMNGGAHPHEGFTTTDPREAFQKMWEMHDVCQLHCVTESTADLLELDRLMNEEGKSYFAASIALEAFRASRARAQAQAS